MSSKILKVSAEIKNVEPDNVKTQNFKILKVCVKKISNFKFFETVQEFLKYVSIGHLNRLLNPIYLQYQFIKMISPKKIIFFSLVKCLGEAMMGSELKFYAASIKFLRLLPNIIPTTLMLFLMSQLEYILVKYLLSQLLREGIKNNILHAFKSKKIHKYLFTRAEIGQLLKLLRFKNPIYYFFHIRKIVFLPESQLEKFFMLLQGGVINYIFQDLKKLQKYTNSECRVVGINHHLLQKYIRLYLALTHFKINSHATGPVAAKFRAILTLKTNAYFETSSNRAPITTSYTCGPTVYARPHIGNFRTYVFESYLSKILTSLGYKKQLRIMNITDIDDKILMRVRTMGGLNKLTKKYTNYFISKLKILGVDTDLITVLTCQDVMNDIIFTIKKMLNKNTAKKTQDGIRFTPGFKTREMKPANFALWKCYGDDKFKVSWGTPWGAGRPGWHIECATIIKTVLDHRKLKILDFHMGGEDLCFPHHYNQMLLLKAWGYDTNTRFFHVKHLTYGTTKMSKSLKNTVYLEDLKTDPKIIRFHYYLHAANKSMIHDENALVESCALFRRMISTIVHKIKKYPLKQLKLSHNWTRENLGYISKIYSKNTAIMAYLKQQVLPRDNDSLIKSAVKFLDHKITVYDKSINPLKAAIFEPYDQLINSRKLVMYLVSALQLSDPGELGFVIGTLSHHKIIELSQISKYCRLNNKYAAAKIKDKCTIKELKKMVAGFKWDIKNKLYLPNNYWT